MDKAVLELTLLGFVSLILMLFQDYIPEICIAFKPEQVQWTLLDNLDNCPCCLENTYGVTTCAMMEHSCGFNSTTKQPYCGCSLGWPESTYDSTVVANASDSCSAYENNEENFIFETVLGALISDISPAEFCKSYANGSIVINPPALAPAGAPALAPAPGAGGGGLRRSLLASSDGAVELQDGLHIVPDVSTFRCEGPFYAGSCSNGSYPAISYSALHQIHLLIFLIAAIHVVTSVCVVIVAGLRIRQWRRWQLQDITHGPHHVINNTADSTTDGTVGGGSVGGGGGVSGGDVAEGANGNREGSVGGGQAARKYQAFLSNVEEIHLPLEQAARKKMDNNTTQAAAAATVVASVEMAQPASVAVAMPQTEATLIEGNEHGEGTTTPPTAPESVTTSVFVSEVVSEVQDAAKTVRRHWMRRDSRLLRKRHRFAEGAICVGQALLPNLVSQYEFSTMRVGYVGSHNLPESYDWVDELMHHLDFDLVKIIGASIVTWLIFILEWLLTGLAGWVSSLFMLIAVLIVFAINIWLVVAIRFSCRGGRPHRIRNVSRWYNNPAWLAYPIGGIVFLCSTSFSTALFFLWQFGASSCFFTSSDQEIWSWLPGSLPWYTGLIAPGVLLIWMAYVTIPAWALVMHMRPKAIVIEAPNKKGEMSGSMVDVEKAQELREQGSRERRTQAAVMADIQKLQNELMELQAPV